MAKVRTEIDIEKLLQWAYRDELSKRQTSSAEGIWDRMQETGQRGGVDPGHGAAQRYSHFGLPDPDAETIERAVSALDPVVVDWKESLQHVAADLAGLVSINDLTPRQERATVSEWTDKNGARRRAENRPRDVLMLGSLRPAALVTMHAIRGNRPDWFDEEPEPRMVHALRGRGASIVGECKGRNIYTAGSYCPLSWEPSPATVIMARAEYAVWWRALHDLAQSLDLAKFKPLSPRAPQAPWLDSSERIGAVFQTPLSPGAKDVLPLAPVRSRTGPILTKRSRPAALPTGTEIA